MKILIAADMEGITGVVHADQTDSTHPEYQRFRRLMTADVNAAIRRRVRRRRGRSGRQRRAWRRAQHPDRGAGWPGAAELRQPIALLDDARDRRRHPGCDPRRLSCPDGHAGRHPRSHLVIGTRRRRVAERRPSGRNWSERGAGGPFRRADHHDFRRPDRVRRGVWPGRVVRDSGG